MSDRYRQAFEEEARELLGELEAALLELDQNRENPEIVGRAFRALHTIKGSGAMFGFDNIAAFTHDLETVFDRLRSGQLAASSELINLTLSAGDQIRAMLDAASGREEADADRSAAILAELRTLTGIAAPAGAPRPPQRVQASETNSQCRWRIHFRPGADVILGGTNPLLLLRELGELGRLEVALDSSAIPPLSEIDPERCYVAWDLTLTTAAPPEAIRDVFIFVEDSCDLAMEPVPIERAAAREPAESRSAAGRSGARASVTGAASSIRVSAEKLDQLVNLVGELVTVQARLSEISARRDDPDIVAVAEEIDRLTGALRENSMRIRMLPLRGTFERFRRLVHDLGIELHKHVELDIAGAETELDKTVIDQLNDPLVHLIRNSMDHGIETAEERRAAGKPPSGTIRLSAMHSGAQVLIRVSDDGRGLDAQAVRTRAVERGLVEPSAQLSESELFSLILAPGFSTAREVTDVSGRGVGMDVVRRNVEALRGSLEMAGKPGEGLTVTLRLPLTLAIIDGLLVRIGETHFILPLASSLECVELTARDIANAHGNRIAMVRGRTVPYIRLSEYLRLGTPRPEREQIMVMETEEGQVVDEVLGNHQTVIKNLGRLYRHVQTVSGATILGNGTVALILDPHRLVQGAIEAGRDRRGGPGRKRFAPAGSMQDVDTINAFTRKENSIHVS